MGLILRAAPVTDRLKYIYLASDVLLQCSKAPEFLPAFQGVMLDAFTAVAGYIRPFNNVR